MGMKEDDFKIKTREYCDRMLDMLQSWDASWDLNMAEWGINWMQVEISSVSID